MNTLWFGVAAGAIQLTAFALYNKNIFFGGTRPNTSTWTMWFFLTALNASSYLVMTGDIVKGILPAASATATILTFLLSLFTGKFSKIDVWDAVTLAVGIIAGFVWYLFKSAAGANLIVQLALVISFVPLYRSLLKDPAKEKPFAWWLWTSAYVLQAVNVLVRWQGQYQDLAYPVVCFFLHGAVALMAGRKVNTA